MSLKNISQFVTLLSSSDRRAEERAQYELERTAKEAGLEGARRQQVSNNPTDVVQLSA